MVNRFKEIYDRLSDEEHRLIYEKRIMYSLTGDRSYVLSLGKEFENKLLVSDEWNSFYSLVKSHDDSIALYSAGYWGRETLLRTGDVAWKFVIDKNPKEESLCGVPTITLSEYLKSGEDCFIVISSRVYYEEIRDELIKAGIASDRIIDGAILFDMSEGKQYFDLDELPHSPSGEVFADVGCYDGLSAFYFDKWCNGEGVSYCFEPDEINIARIKKVLEYKKVSSYKLIDKGVWSSTGRISFVSTGNSVSHVSDAAEIDDGASSIEVTTLDDALFDKNVTFIKMDIEGAEYEALKGAERIIREQKPKLAICVYHKPQDIWELPELILDYNKEYRFYLRHYSYRHAETVLYAF